MLFKLRGKFAFAAVTLLFATSLTATSANASGVGLYGKSDPSYDGVFRQSLAILGLVANHRPVPNSAKSWLLSQQCADGSFQAFHEVGTDCWDLNDAWTGKDTNSTAIAAVALVAIGREIQARQAVRWLRSVQNVDGGMAFGGSGVSDSQSTALTLSAVRAIGRPASKFSKNGKTLISFLRRSMVSCAQPAERGAFSYQITKPVIANDMASGQVLAAFASLPQQSRSTIAAAPRLKCPTMSPIGITTMQSALAGYLARRLNQSGGVLPSPYGGTDWATTQWATIGLVGAGVGGHAISAAVEQLAENAAVIIRDAAGAPAAGKIGLTLLVAAAAKQNPKNFGGLDLVELLQKELT